MKKRGLTPNKRPFPKHADGVYIVYSFEKHVLSPPSVPVHFHGYN